MKHFKTNKPNPFCGKKIAKVLAVATMMILTCAALALPASAATFDPNMSTEGLVGGIVEFVITAAKYIGIVIAASGIFMFIMAYKDDNAESQSRGARMAVVGALLIGLKPLLKLTGLITG